MGRTPPRKLSSRKTQLQSGLEVETDKSFARCPDGHPLPRKTQRGRCTPLACADKLSMAEVKTHHLTKRTAEKAMSEIPGVTLAKEEDAEDRIVKVTGDEELRVKIQSARKKVWQDFLQIPIDLRGADAEKHADEELVNMLPFAVGVIKKQLLFGSEEQQERAANKVLDANGRGKRESPGASTPSIIINMANGVAGATGIQLPWRGAPEAIASTSTVISSSSSKALPPKDKT